MGDTAVDTMIRRTIEANANYVKSPEYKNTMVDTLAPVVAVCFQDHSPERTKQLEGAFDTIDTILVRESPLVSWMYYLMSDARKRDGQYQSAVDYAMESLKLREEIYGDDSNEVCICLDHLASLLFDIGQYAQACKFFLQAIETKSKMGYSLLPQLCRECVSLAVSIKELKEYNMALQLLERAKVLISTPVQSSPHDDFRKSVVDMSLAAAYANDGDDKADQQERDSVKLQILFVMGSIYEIMGNMDKLLSVYENLLEIYTSAREQETVRDVATTYEYLLRTYFSLDRYHLIRPSVANLLQYVREVDGKQSCNMAIALRIAANNFRDLSDTNSPTKLCDFADAVRYYICTMKIAADLSNPEEREQIGINELRAQVELLFYNTRPLKKEECTYIVDKLLTIPLDTLMDGTKTQNQFLKVVYPNFMAEDALREKHETIPKASGVLHKYGLMKSWKSRFFVVDRDTFYYYEFPSDPKPQGEYNLIEIKHIEVLPVEKKYKPHTHCFSLVTPKRNVVLACESQESMQEWVSTLTKAKAYWEEWYAPPL